VNLYRVYLLHAVTGARRIADVTAGSVADAKKLARGEYPDAAQWQINEAKLIAKDVELEPEPAEPVEEVE
jgi:hypothetical protein